MHLTRTALMSFGAIAVTGLLWAATAQEKKPEPGKQDKPAKEEKAEKMDKKGMVFVSSEEAKYKDAIPGVSRAVISGDPDKGAYSAFTKLAPGTSHAMHTHTSELHIVVLKGAYVFKPEKGEEKRVGPGCYLSIPAGERHASGGDAKDGALFFEEGSGKFDLVPVEKEKK